MASSSHSSSTLGYCVVSLSLNGREYSNVKLSVMANLCCDIILGHHFLCKHSSTEIPFRGSRPSLTFCRLTAIKKCSLLISVYESNLRLSSRRHSIPDAKFIQSEISRMLKESIIEPSQSPWRAQTLVVSPENHKKRLVDYSQTINWFTLLDAYPLPRKEDIVNEIASVCHQIAVELEAWKYAVFKGAGSL